MAAPATTTSRFRPRPGSDAQGPPVSVAGRPRGRTAAVRGGVAPRPPLRLGAGATGRGLAGGLRAARILGGGGSGPGQGQGPGTAGAEAVPSVGAGTRLRPWALGWFPREWRAPVPRSPHLTPEPSSGLCRACSGEAGPCPAARRWRGAGRCLAGGRLVGDVMKGAEARRLLAANLLSVFAVALTAVVPAFFWEGFTVLGTHLAWLCVCSAGVGALRVVLHLVLNPNQSPKKSSCAHKVSFAFLNGYQAVPRGSEFFRWNDQVRKQEKATGSGGELLFSMSELRVTTFERSRATFSWH